MLYTNTPTPFPFSAGDMAGKRRSFALGVAYISLEELFWLIWADSAITHQVFRLGIQVMRHCVVCAPYARAAAYTCIFFHRKSRKLEKNRSHAPSPREERKILGAKRISLYMLFKAATHPVNSTKPFCSGQAHALIFFLKQYSHFEWTIRSGWHIVQILWVSSCQSCYHHSNPIQNDKNTFLSVSLFE